MVLFAGQPWILREQSYGPGGGEDLGRREWDKWRERHGDSHTAVRETDSQWGLLCDSGSSNRGSGTPTGMGREVQRERTHVCRWLVHVDAAETNTVCKAITLPLNVNFKKIRNEVILELDVFED